MSYVSYRMFHPKKKKHIHLQRALLKFCTLIDPLWKAFHPTFFKGGLLSENRSRMFFDDPANIEKLLNEAYQKSLEKHYQENPFGPLPKAIIFFRGSNPSSPCYKLQWVSRRGNGTLFRLCLFPVQNRTSLLIKGRDLTVVWEYAQQAGLQKPVYEQHRGALVLTPIIADLKSLLQIPMSEVLSLIQKYAR